VPTETCQECGFDAGEYNLSDLIGTLRAIAPMWQEAIEGVDAAVIAQRPAPAVWSALEYAAHSREITGAMGYLLHLAVTEEHPVVAEAPTATPEPVLPRTIDQAIAELESNAARLTRKAGKLTDDDWNRGLSIGDTTVDATWIVGHAVHDAIHHLCDLGRGLHALGAGAPTRQGTVVQLNTSGGGVPKAPVESATIDRRGVVGDTQADRKHHGRPLQALSLWSLEVIDSLRADGHTVHPGAAGENVTISGVKWSTIRTGVRVRIGEVLAEISAFATPCAKNAQWFADRDFHRIEHSVNPGTSRAYAWVLETGTVRTDDPVIVEPPPRAPGQ